MLMICKPNLENNSEIVCIVNSLSLRKLNHIYFSSMLNVRPSYNLSCITTSKMCIIPSLTTSKMCIIPSLTAYENAHNTYENVYNTYENM